MKILLIYTFIYVKKNHSTRESSTHILITSIGLSANIIMFYRNDELS